MKRQWLVVSVLVVALLVVTALPRVWSQRPGVPHPYSLWPASDAAFDLGVAGVKETAYRWRNAFLSSAAFIGATNAAAASGALEFGPRAEGTTAPGSGYAKLFFRPGTTAGSCQLVAVAGTSPVEVVIQDNIGAGGCGNK